jgi:hypothetical protein
LQGDGHTHLHTHTHTHNIWSIFRDKLSLLRSLIFFTAQQTSKKIHHCIMTKSVSTLKKGATKKAIKKKGKFYPLLWRHLHPPQFLLHQCWQASLSCVCYFTHRVLMHWAYDDVVVAFSSSASPPKLPASPTTSVVSVIYWNWQTLCHQQGCQQCHHRQILCLRKKQPFVSIGWTIMRLDMR